MADAGNDDGVDLTLELRGPSDLKLHFLFSTDKRLNPFIYSWIGELSKQFSENRDGGLRAAVLRAKGSTEGIRRLGSHRHAGRSFFFE